MPDPYGFRALMLPSLGFFGGTWADFLDLPVGRVIRGLSLRIDAPRKEFLNLRGVLVVRDGRPLPLRPADYTVEQSSDRPASELPPQGISGLTGIHTLRENGPWWRVTFDEPQHVDAIDVFNRRDRLGVRSRSLAVQVLEMDGTTSTIYEAASRGHFADTLNVIEMYAGGRCADARVSTEAEAQKWRTDTVRALNDSLRRGAPVPTAAEWLKIASLIPSSSNSRLEGEDWFLLAYGLCAQLKRDSRSRSGIYSYSGVLDSRNALSRLEAEFDDARRALDSEPLQLLKHGVSPLGALRRELPGIQKLYPILREDLAESGLTPLLAYGTLLGARRNGKVMDHDDDFDLMVVLDASCYEDFERCRGDLLDSLRSKGWKVWENGKNKNSHLGRGDLDGHLDLFCAWRHDDVVETHMERMAWRGVPARYFQRTTSIELEGQIYPAPGETDEFLQDRYGPGWRVPDKFHDWRWPLTEDAPVASN